MILCWIGFSALLVVTRCIQIVRGSAQKPTLLFCACGSAIAATALVPTQRSERLGASFETTSRQGARIQDSAFVSIWHDIMISGETKGYSKANLPLAKSRLESLAMQNFLRKVQYTKQQQEKSMPSLPDLLSPLHNCCRSTRVRCRAMASSKARLDGFHKL